MEHLRKNGWSTCWEGVLWIYSEHGKPFSGRLKTMTLLLSEQLRKARPLKQDFELRFKNCTVQKKNPFVANCVASLCMYTSCTDVQHLMFILAQCLLKYFTVGSPSQKKFTEKFGCYAVK